jgi:hypothetical protein
MTSSTLGVDPKTKITSYSLFHDIISLFSYFTLHTEILSIMLLLISNCCQSQECRAIITKVYKILIYYNLFVIKHCIFFFFFYLFVEQIIISYYIST